MSDPIEEELEVGEDDRNESRKILEPYEGRRMRFRAEVGAPGTREKNIHLPTLCLYNLYLINQWGEEFYVSDHVWVDKNRALSRAFVERGQVIEFKADVIHYLKGGPKTVSTRYGRRRIELPYTGSDYGLRRVGCVRKADKTQEKDNE